MEKPVISVAHPNPLLVAAANPADVHPLQNIAVARDANLRITHLVLSRNELVSADILGYLIDENLSILVGSKLLRVGMSELPQDMQDFLRSSHAAPFSGLPLMLVDDRPESSVDSPSSPGCASPAG